MIFTWIMDLGSITALAFFCLFLQIMKNVYNLSREFL